MVFDCDVRGGGAGLVRIGGHCVSQVRGQKLPFLGCGLLIPPVPVEELVEKEVGCPGKKSLKYGNGQLMHYTIQHPGSLLLILWWRPEAIVKSGEKQRRLECQMSV